MTCRRCQGCMARDHYLDLQESGGWWLEGWRCINCGYVFDPVLEQNRRLQEAATVSSLNAAREVCERTASSEQERGLDIAA